MQEKDYGNELLTEYVRKEANIPSESLKSGVCWVNLGPDTKQAHQRIAVVARKILCSLSLVQTFQCERDKLKLTEDHAALIVIDELNKVSHSSFQSSKEGISYLACNMGIFFPHFRSKLVLRDKQWYPKITAAHVDLDVFSSRRKKDLGESPDSSAPLLKHEVGCANTLYIIWWTTNSNGKRVSSSDDIADSVHLVIAVSTLISIRTELTLTSSWSWSGSGIHEHPTQYAVTPALRAAASAI